MDARTRVLVAYATAAGSTTGIADRLADTLRTAGADVVWVAQAFPPSLAPREHRMFGGIIDMEHTPLRGRLFFRATGGRPGDHRDWAAVEAWAGEIAAALPAPRTPAAPAGEQPC